ncbi:transmembrane protein, putative (macronuclear) [Tetrahymena thermophila SB210]|uniref:Transmembrane protein, putative n=1 Tax=Tetrahymena thermophila (strain SB210) TaxID=312017 RepID=Q22EB3_TETTS|nr:transmembrane protein, putative [Tetrahymena thermophila SB210]EAR83615.1 transmembrane protein, putative [Tetrahymena thermophila SB210]|eukprot:XP_001031278.1 transmembrane protein, putative [Tetrahymena thermophila SB210]
MNKILYLIPALLLVGAGILLIQGNQNNLSADNDYVTYGQYLDCMTEKVFHKEPCMETDSFVQTKEKAVQYLNTDPICLAYAKLQERYFYLNIVDTAPLNYDQLYQNCRASPEFLAIVQQDYDCLYTKFIVPELKLCSGLNL